MSNVSYVGLHAEKITGSVLKRHVEEACYCRLIEGNYQMPQYNLFCGSSWNIISAGDVQIVLLAYTTNYPQVHIRCATDASRLYIEGLGQSALTTGRF